jgi:hypothetical protein
MLATLLSLVVLLILERTHEFLDIFLIVLIIALTTTFILITFQKLRHIKQKLSQLQQEIDVLLEKRVSAINILISQIQSLNLPGMALKEDVHQLIWSARRALQSGDKLQFIEIEQHISNWVMQLPTLFAQNPEAMQQASLLEIQTQLIGLENQLLSVTREYDEEIQKYKKISMRPFGYILKKLFPKKFMLDQTAWSK